MQQASGLVFILIFLAVGRETVLSTAVNRDLRCGRRLVSGLFSRPRLPLGYSYVTTVPKGACRLNVSEIIPTENYIALKISNSSYIMNGEFAVSAPGTYEAAGARFIYTRNNELDSIVAHGPIHYPIDIMILYTEPNPSIKYEYFTEALPGEIVTESTPGDYINITPVTVSKHIRRHHNYDVFSRINTGAARHFDTNKETSSTEYEVEENVVGSRSFVWKIMSYTQCTRSCGGGIQLGKYRCVELNADKEVSSVYCTGSPPSPRRRRCGGGPCPPRWRAAAWSSCPPCGPATRSRLVGCVQDHSRGITKISDQKCPPPKPTTTDKCNIPDCNEITGRVRISSKRVLNPREQTDTFRAEPVYAVSNSTVVGPEYSFTATAGWLFTEWSECTGWCVGGGIQTRGVRCSDPSGCTPRKAPDNSRTCTPKLNCEPLEGQWFTSSWSPCSSNCGGKQIRGVLCIGGTGRHLKDSACRAPKPAQEQDCGTECGPTWYFGDWSQCASNCTGGTNGIQRRSVVCARNDDTATTDAECGTSPAAVRNCDPQCISPSVTTPAPSLIIEAQRVSGSDTTTTQRITTKDYISKECKDNLPNCLLAVQARLCHYKYYTQNCCHSCAGR